MEMKNMKFKSFSRMIMLASLVAMLLSLACISARAQYDSATNTIVAFVRPNMITTSQTNGIVFTNGAYLGTGTFLFTATNWSGSTPTHDCKIQHSDDAVTWVDVTGGAFAQFTTTNTVQALNFRMQDLKQYLRVTNTITGTTVTNLYSITIIAPSKYR
jgi:hypothetical protein